MSGVTWICYRQGIALYVLLYITVVDFNARCWKLLMQGLMQASHYSAYRLSATEPIRILCVTFQAFQFSYWGLTGDVSIRNFSFPAAYVHVKKPFLKNGFTVVDGRTCPLCGAVLSLYHVGIWNFCNLWILSHVHWTVKINIPEIQTRELAKVDLCEGQAPD